MFEKIRKAVRFCRFFGFTISTVYFWIDYGLIPISEKLRKKNAAELIVKVDVRQNGQL